MRHAFDGILIGLCLILLSEYYEAVNYIPPKTKKDLGRSLSSIMAPIDLIKNRSHKRLAKIPQSVGLNSSEHVLSDEVVVAILDTGINLNSRWLMNSVLEINGEKQIYDLSHDTEDGSDKHGHGTLMASIILSINPKAKIVPIKCLGGDFGDESYARALRMASMIPGVTIINISGGGEQYDEWEDREISRAINNGITIVAASGNGARDLAARGFYPASLNSRQEGMITVANLGRDGNLEPTSNFGEEIVDVGILGTMVPGYDHEGEVIYQSGSSQAAAMVSGVASLVKGIRPELTPKDLEDVLISTASIFPKLKHGKVNAKNAIHHARGYSKPLKNLKSKIVSLNQGM